ncbi:SDR family oxidoreductase [Agrobacterium sp. BA1120]|uniref:SDR family oxidoreductase n=1 Tax=Agrobacterium sp. BA1120 TaxID=3228927 RepID=UPI00336AE5B0
MHVIITGGSSGIGLAVARLAVAEGHKVSIIARNPDRLRDALKALDNSAHTQAVCADVKDAIAIDNAIRTCMEKFGDCDVLVTSAGIVEPALFNELTEAQFNEQFETNFLGTVNAVRAVYPLMKTRGNGSIMMIASGAALIGIPGYTAYCASKAALASFAESLRSEVGQDVHVGISFPPDTLTPQLAVELPKRPVAAQALMGSHKAWPVEKVAEGVFNGIRRRKKQVHFGWELEALAWLGPFIKPFIYKKVRR